MVTTKEEEIIGNIPNDLPQTLDEKALILKYWYGMEFRQVVDTIK